MCTSTQIMYVKCIGCVCVCAHVKCIGICKQLSGNQSFDRQISAHKKGGGVMRVGQWIRTSNCLQVCYMTLIGVHFTMHLVDPYYCRVTYTCVCVCVYIYDMLPSN